MPPFLQRLLLEAAFALAKPLITKVINAVVEEVSEAVESVEARMVNKTGSKEKHDIAVKIAMAGKNTSKLLPGYYEMTPEKKGVTESILGAIVDGVVKGKNDSKQFKHKVGR